jgi:hypothetical protein
MFYQDVTTPLWCGYKKITKNIVRIQAIKQVWAPRTFPKPSTYMPQLQGSTLTPTICRHYKFLTIIFTITKLNCFKKNSFYIWLDVIIFWLKILMYTYHIMKFSSLVGNDFVPIIIICTKFDFSWGLIYFSSWQIIFG